MQYTMDREPRRSPVGDRKEWLGAFLRYFPRTRLNYPYFLMGHVQRRFEAGEVCSEASGLLNRAAEWEDAGFTPTLYTALCGWVEAFATSDHVDHDAVDRVLGIRRSERGRSQPVKIHWHGPGLQETDWVGVTAETLVERVREALIVPNRAE